MIACVEQTHSRGNIQTLLNMFMFVGHSPHTLSLMRRDDCGVFLNIIVERENTPYDDVTRGSSFRSATCHPWQQKNRQEQQRTDASHHDLLYTPRCLPTAANFSFCSSLSVLSGSFCWTLSLFWLLLSPSLSLFLSLSFSVPDSPVSPWPSLCVLPRVWPAD